MEGLQMWMISIVFLLSLAITEGSHPLIVGEQLHKGDFTNKLSFIQEDTESPGRLLGLIDNQLVEILPHTIKTIKALGDERTAQLGVSMGVKFTTVSKPSSFIQQGRHIITTHPRSKCLCKFSAGFIITTRTPTYSGYCNSKYNEVRYGDQSLTNARYTYPYHIASINNQSMELYVTDGRVIKKIDQAWNIVSVVYEDSDQSHIFYRLVASGDRMFVSTSRGIRVLTNNFERSDFLAFTTHSDNIQGRQDRPNNTASTCDFPRMIDGHFATSGSEGAGQSPFPITDLVPITPSVLLAVRCDDKYQMRTECKEPKLTLIDIEAGLMTDACCKHSEMLNYCDMKFMPGYIAIMNHTLYITNEFQQAMGDLQPLLDSFKLRDYCTDCGGRSRYALGTALPSGTSAPPCYSCALDITNLEVGWDHCKEEFNITSEIGNANQSYCLETNNKTQTTPPTSTKKASTTTSKIYAAEDTTTLHSSDMHIVTTSTNKFPAATERWTNASTVVMTMSNSSTVTMAMLAAESNTSSPPWTQLENKIIYVSIAALIAVIASIVSGILCVLKVRHRKNRVKIRTGPLPTSPYSDNQIYDFIGDEFYENISDTGHDSTNNSPPVLKKAWPNPGDMELQVISSASVSSAEQNIGVYASDTNCPIEAVSGGTV